MDLAPSPRSYFKGRFTAGSRPESTERSVALALVWIALGILALVCLDRPGTDLSQSPAVHYSFGFIVYSMLILLLLGRPPECSDILRLPLHSTDLVCFALLSLFAHESRAALFLLLLVLARAAQHWGLSGMLKAASDKGCWKRVIDEDGCGFDFDGQPCLPELDATPRAPVVLRERVCTLGGELAVESTHGRRVRLEFALPKEACG